MKSYLKKVLSSIAGRELSDIRNLRVEAYNSQIIQRQLLFRYQELRNNNQPLPRWGDTGFRVFSQNDEDGLLLYLFSLLGTTNKVCVDVAFGVPYGANTTNLICNWGWTGLLIDGNKESLEQSRQFFCTHKDCFIYPPRLVHAWVTAENINQLLESNGITGEIDLLSLDVDGSDYWLWRSIDVIQPRVVVLEYLNFWGADKAVTIPYKADFARVDPNSDYFGASLAAFVSLGREKGYRLVGANRYDFNAFFVRTGIGEDIFSEIAAAECLKHPQAQDGKKHRLPNVIDYEWIEV